MGRRFALRPDIFRGSDQTGAKDLLPESIDGDARGQRIGGINKPLRQAEPIARS